MNHLPRTLAKAAARRVLLILACCAAAAAQAQLKIEITSGVTDPIPIAIVPFAHTGAADGGLDVAAVVQHVQILEQSGVIVTHKAGRVRTCRIEPRTLRAAETWIAQRRGLWEQRLDRLGQLLAEEPETMDARKENS